MSEVFYRFHWADSPEFSAANAWSVLWGAERNEDGSKTRCRDCGVFAYEDDDCRTCDGTGWEDASEGYSACNTANELIAYFAQIGNGFEGEALVIPTRVIETMPWSTFVAKLDAH